jgi:hypothetical protein
MRRRGLEFGLEFGLGFCFKVSSRGNKKDHDVDDEV